MKNNPNLDPLTNSGAAETSGRALGFRPRRILVVDDEPAARVLASRIFSEAAFEVTTVSSGFECIDQFRKRPHWFDLIVLDLSMPFMDGEETFRRLRAINPNVVVLLSTGFFAEAQGRLDRMLATGLAGFIRKPHRPDELLAEVESVLERVKLSRIGCVASDMASSA
jgi:two-component system, cell cycle sensor histidine kinase and response regulator CckA